MNLDISHILNDWAYDSGQISARKIRGRDGTDKIQLRLDLGLLQMEPTGRPDGLRPRGHESLLHYYEHQLRRRRRKDSSDTSFELDEQACELLRNEAAMYYHRYLAEFVLEEYEAVVRDTSRNLRLMDLCGTYAQEESDRYILTQYRPYVLMMRTRARGLLALRDNRPKAALAAVREGMKEIEGCYEGFEDEAPEDGTREVAILRALVKEIEDRIPPDPVKRVEKALSVAVREERYEDAASLRDQLRSMTGGSLSGGEL